MKARPLRGVVVTALFLGAVLTGLPGTARPAYSGQNGRIAFVSDRDDYQSDIYTMNADGSSLTRCARDGMRDDEPAWSPNGTQIAFSSVDLTGAGGGDERDLYVMDADCGNVRRLTTDHLDPDIDPTWSPDGNRIAFMRDHDDTGWDIYVRDLRTGVDTNLTHLPSADNEAPAWSPDGTRIAFESQRDNPFGEIYVMDAGTGNNVTRITDTAGSRGAAWSPDSKKIAYGSGGAVHVRDLETGETTDLNNVSGTGLAWSPDGDKFVFMSHRDGNWEIYVMDAATGDNQTRLTNHGAFDSNPDWQPIPAPPPPPGPCILLSTGSASAAGDFSTASHRSFAFAQPRAQTITNCGDSNAKVNVRGTDATGASGTWQLTNRSSGGAVDSLCELGTNLFRNVVFLPLASGGANGTTLTTEDRPLIGDNGTDPLVLVGHQAHDFDIEIELPCVGSVGIGEPMTTNVTFTAIAP